MLPGPASMAVSDGRLLPPIERGGVRPALRGCQVAVLMDQA
jgi:hypothetical protein